MKRNVTSVGLELHEQNLFQIESTFRPLVPQCFMLSTVQVLAKMEQNGPLGARDPLRASLRSQTWTRAAFPPRAQCGQRIKFPPRLLRMSPNISGHVLWVPHGQMPILGLGQVPKREELLISEGVSTDPSWLAPCQGHVRKVPEPSRNHAVL